MAVRKKSRAAYHHGDLRRAVIDAALVAIERDGIAALSLRELARKLAVSHQAPYRHFADKDALLAAIADEGFRTLVQRLRAGPPLTGHVTRALTESGVAYVRFAVEHPAHYRVMFATGGERRDPLATPGGAYDLLATGVARGQAAGVLPAAPKQELALLCWTVAHGLAMLAIDGKLGPAPAALATARATIALQVHTLAVAARAR